MVHATNMHKCNKAGGMLVVFCKKVVEWCELWLSLEYVQRQLLLLPVAVDFGSWFALTAIVK